MENFEKNTPKTNETLKLNDTKQELTQFSMEALKTTVTDENPIIKYREKLEKSVYFSKVHLKPWEVLFDEWDIDNNLYIILKWQVSVDKYTTTEKKDIKELAILWTWEFFWEGALKRTEEKQVSIRAINDVELLYIDAKNWIQDFIKQEPELWTNILVHIIDTWNKRLLESNYLVTSNFEMSKHISQIESFDNKNIFSLIDSFHKIIWVDYIIFLEKNPVMDNYMTIKYDSRNKWIMQDNIVDLWDKKLDIDDLKRDWVQVVTNNYIQELRSWNSIIWYLVIGRNKKWFSTNEIKVITSISSSLAWVIRQKEYSEEEMNKEYIKAA